jgi:hypothetical protein
MRRLPLFLSLLSVLALPGPPASAQDAAAVRLTLLSQTPWNSAFDPENGRELVLRFRAENLGATALDELSIGVTLYGRASSRTAFEQSLVSDPSLALEVETRAREGVLEPEEIRDFELTFLLDSDGIDPDDSGVYPLKVDLRSRSISVAVIRTAAVFLVRQPDVPLRLSWTFVLHHPIEFGPDGVFTSPALETALAPGGRLAAEIRALVELATLPPQPAVDVAVSPVLLRQLEMMRDGYEVLEGVAAREVAPGEGGAALAEEALGDLRAIARAPNVRMSALPFSAPELPSLVAGGLSRDLSVQLARGREVVAESLDTTPVSGILRPPGAALDDATLRELSAAGVSTLVVGPSTVETSLQPLGFAGPPTAALGDEGTVRAVVPDPAVAALLQSAITGTDPVRAAQVVLGDITSIWQEQPGVLRGIALVVSEDFPPSFFVPFARAVANAPWLSTMHAGEFTSAFPPADLSLLTVALPRRFSSEYVDELRLARRDVSTYRSMLVNPSEEPDRLETMLLFAESRQYLANPTEGLAFITGVRDAVGGVFDAVRVDSASVITLTSSTGSGVPVTVHNSAESALRVHVRLESQFLRGSPGVDLELRPGDTQTVTFRVEARSTGRFTVELQVLSPGGRCSSPSPPLRCIIDEQTLVVRSTAYNRIALTITIAAALVLLALWARRFLPRRTS